MSDVRIIVDDSALHAKVDRIQADVDRLLKKLVRPSIEFTFGPTTEQEQYAHGRQQADPD